MERNIQIKITCGEKTCASEPGKFCEFMGSRKFGNIPICTLFPSTYEVITDLKEIEGWVQRCEACLNSEV